MCTLNFVLAFSHTETTTDFTTTGQLLEMSPLCLVVALKLYGALQILWWDGDGNNMIYIIC